MINPKTEKAWSYLTASLRLCNDAYRILQDDKEDPELKALELSISELLKAKSMVGRRIHG
ncbi:MAG: hypothetical protein DM484_15785 [Candidatus Methylumidiphilus alinenensis]|uniref:Uncharacterized protein n=1 Tax=Candidatus Methylumidiphilus alinenensis TaxID=2202197 RepID=A0A2W4RA89_9GAMM|nr:MAG: hypothetical protein DM484_15785 [Candidatus Methylumidiphilus alinenensis]